MKKFAAILAAMVLTLGGAAMTVAATDTQIPDTSVTAEEGIADGIYTMSAEMIQLNKTDKSMANEAIDHTVILEVENGECYITVTFKSLKFLGQEGYLQSLSYFDAGYEISQYGVPKGEVIPAEVLSSYDGVVDFYNKGTDIVYPKELRFKVVNGANAEYIPLQVFVPVMEAISEGSGTQSVYMKPDWTSVEKYVKDDDIDPSSGQDDDTQSSSESAAQSSSSAVEKSESSSIDESSSTNTGKENSSSSSKSDDNSSSSKGDNSSSDTSSSTSSDSKSDPVNDKDSSRPEENSSKIESSHTDSDKSIGDSSSKPNDSSKPDDSKPDAPKPGDVNGDGKVNVTDISKVAAHVKGIKKLDSESAADVNGDGKVNVTDISKIAAHVKGIKALF